MSIRIAVLWMAAWSGVASAATIWIDSSQGLFTSVADVQTVAITPHYAWEPNNPVNPGDSTDHSAVWISNTDSGFGGTQFQAPGGTAPVATVFYGFQSGAGLLTLYVWADDTASVLLDGNLLMPAVFTQSVCSGQAIGCRPEDVGSVSAVLAEGRHTLSFELYQVGTGMDSSSNPFGLLFTGTAPAPVDNVDLPANSAASDSGVPEPGTCGLLGIGVTGLILLARRRHMRT